MAGTFERALPEKMDVVSNAALRELNCALVTFYDSPEYRQLFAAYCAPPVEASYRRREAVAARYRRYGPLVQPETRSWDILTEEHVTGDAILRDVDAAALARQSEFAADYAAELERGITTLQQTNKNLIARVADQRRFSRVGSLDESVESPRE
jgi:hypothetical protein